MGHRELDCCACRWCWVRRRWRRSTNWLLRPLRYWLWSGTDYYATYGPRNPWRFKIGRHYFTFAWHKRGRDGWGLKSWYYRTHRPFSNSMVFEAYTGPIFVWFNIGSINKPAKKKKKPTMIRGKLRLGRYRGSWSMHNRGKGGWGLYIWYWRQRAWRRGTLGLNDAAHLEIVVGPILLSAAIFGAPVKEANDGR